MYLNRYIMDIIYKNICIYIIYRSIDTHYVYRYNKNGIIDTQYIYNIYYIVYNDIYTIENE